MSFVLSAYCFNDGELSRVVETFAILRRRIFANQKGQRSACAYIINLLPEITQCDFLIAVRRERNPEIARNLQGVSCGTSVSLNRSL